MKTIEQAPKKTTVFIGGQLIDCLNDESIPDAVVVVQNDTITAVGKRGSIHIPDAADIFDISGKTLLPGLIDAHVHVGNLDVALTQTMNLPPAVYVHRVTRNLEMDLQLGFTTLRDAGGLDWGFKEATHQGLIKGPQLYLSVSPMTPTGGHFDLRKRMQVAPVPRNSLGVFPEIRDGIDDVRAGAREVLRQGADQIKVSADGGVATSDQPGKWQYSVEEFKTIVNVAQSVDTYVMAHAYTTQSVMNCLEGGIKSIEHGNLMNFDCAQRMAECGAYYVPTLSVFDILSNEGISQLEPQYQDRCMMMRDASVTALEYTMKAGVMIGSGSDSMGSFQALKGRELGLKAKVMGPMNAIKSATRVNAHIIGQNDRIGTIEPGKIADLIIVDGDPLLDMSIFEDGLESVRFVMKAGAICKNNLICNEKRGDV